MTSGSSLGGGDPASLGSALLAEGCGRRVGRYTLLRRIAAGGMAEVYLARAEEVPGFSKRVALKKILPQHAHRERFVDMLLDEAKITVGLAHPNIAQVFELGLEGEDFFIVMEYVPGPPLSRVLRRVDERARGEGRLPVSHAVHIVGEVLKGLEHAHARTDEAGRPLGIVHRDVSPQNVLVTYDGAVKLIDFGIARATGRVVQTQAGVIKGKLRYLAPEIAAGDEPDHRADVFCAGILLFELLTGEALYAPRTDYEAIEMATRALVRSPRATNPDVPPELDALVMSALAREPADRPATAGALQEDLRRFLNRYDPSFVESELQRLMQDLFQDEQASNRVMDAEAERLARETTPQEASPEAPRYQQLVTGTFVLDRARRSEPGLVEAEPAEASSGVAATEDRGGPSRTVPLLMLMVAAAGVFLAGFGAFWWARRDVGPVPPSPAVAKEGAAPGPAFAPPPAMGQPVPGPGRPASASPEGAPTSLPPLGATTKAPPPPSSAAPRSTPEAPSSSAARPRPRGRGTLVINTRPASEVYVDGRSLGRTPVRKRLSAGRHRIVLKGPEGAKKVMTRRIRAGREDQLIYRWPR